MRCSSRRYHPLWLSLALPSCWSTAFSVDDYASSSGSVGAGVSDGGTPSSGAGGSGGDAQGGTGAGGTGGFATCSPGTVQACAYAGPDGTENVGACKSASQTCEPSGSWGACVGEVLPTEEDCSKPGDEDCDGQSDEAPCSVVHHSDNVTGVAIDSGGNVLVVGNFKSPSTFGGPDENISLGSDDGFVAKYSPTGEFVWAKTFGTTGNDRFVAISVDTNDDVVVIGTVDDGPINFGTGELASSGGKYEATIVKLAGEDGLALWANRYGSTAGVGGIAISPTNEIAFTGGTNTFVRILESDTGQDAWMQPTGGAVGLGVVFAGDLLWLAGYLSGPDIAGVKAAGYHEPGESVLDGFLAKLNWKTKTVLSAAAYGGTGEDGFRNLAIDHDGNLLAAGWFKSASASFGNETFTLEGPGDNFLAKYGADGSPIWSIQFTKAELRETVAFDKEGNAFVGGLCSESFELGGKQISNKPFVLKLDPDSNPLWVNQTIPGRYLSFATGSDGQVAVGSESGLRVLDKDGNEMPGF